ncbi:MAG: MATE family efflux transporter, partial [Clostridiales bacterium]|nr:MATE family efflux transporter [Clostridiales bacterium]
MELDEKHIRMTTHPVEKLIVSLAVPTIIIMLVTAMYNTADTYFVGKLGNAATGGVGVSFAVMSVIQAFGFFFGQGAGNFISRALGAKEHGRASEMAVTSLIYAFGFGCLITLVGLIFLKPIALLLGSTETILPHAMAYLRFIFIGAPFMVISITLNHLLRFQGSAFFSMIGLTAGAVLNVALDPLFIFVFGLGTGGAAIATLISQAFGCAMLFIGCSKGDNLRLRLSNFTPGFSTLQNIITGGLPSFFRQALSCIAVIILNNLARQFGDAAIASVSVVNRIV